MSLGNRKSKDLMQELGDASSPQLVHLVFAEDSSEMVLKKGKGWGKKAVVYKKWTKNAWGQLQHLQMAGDIPPSVKHSGGYVLVWGCIRASGVGDCAKIDGIMNMEK